jgi:signal transduction histidine kinase
VLGLLLVIASIALLLAGAVFGLYSYMDAGKLTEHKLDSIKVLAILRDHVHEIASGSHPQQPPDEQRRYIFTKIAQLRGNIEYYRQHRANAASDENSEDEEARLGLVEDRLTALEAAVRATERPNISYRGDSRILDEPAPKDAYQKLVEDSTALMLSIHTHIERAIDRARANHRRGMVIVVSGTCVGVVLVLTLLYYFEVWVFIPVRKLQAGMQRVHGGDFDNPIRLHSQDELEELANEFNAMTARLRDIYKDLARQVNERSRQLVRSERMVSVGFLAAGVAHEINNPLASIAFCAEAMERRLQEFAAVAKGGDAEAVVKYLKVIQQEAFRCKQITQKLLDFSRSGERRREPTDLGRLIQDVIDVTRVLPDHRGKAIQFTPVSLFAPVSPPDIKSVVLNLIVNALESMDNGGTLAISLHQEGEFAEVSFRDSGCGMTAEVLENIFEPFFTRRRTGNGTGLGLSISHQIIDQHGGGIAAASDGPGKGSTFVVRLPLRAAEAAAEGGAEAVVLAFPGAKAA